MWPPDDDHIKLLQEPKTMPYYVVGRFQNSIPWTWVIELETMKIVKVEAYMISQLRTLLAATPARQ